MALNAVEIAILAHLVSTAPSRPSILFLGYPDLLTDPQTWPLQSPSWDEAPKREGASAVWLAHGRQHLQDQPMVETKALFQSLGADVTIGDAIAWGGEDVRLDLNRPTPFRLRRKYDLIVDPGTLEHCFNVAQAFDNIDAMLKPGGLVYHQEAISFPNHGFWSISPTAFFDFYQSRGYELGVPYRFGPVLDQNGFLPELSRIDPFTPNDRPNGRMIGAYTFRKTRHRTRLPWRKTFPVQRCYSELSRDIDLVDLVPASASRPQLRPLMAS